jgi:phosphatidylinositol kinase/protein kinase (PI-3  family)
MTCLKKIWKQAGLSLWLRPYNILITSSNSAMIEFMPDTISIHALKKQLLQHPQADKLSSLALFYRWYYGPRFEEAQRNFIRSLAGYSVFCYVFNVKDRHNGNIMLSRNGHLLHIDFGFMMQNSPG